MICNYPPYDLTASPRLPNAESISKNILLLPCGEEVSLDIVDLICSIILFSHDNSREIKNKLSDD